MGSVSGSGRFLLQGLDEILEAFHRKSRRLAKLYEPLFPEPQALRGGRNSGRDLQRYG